MPRVLPQDSESPGSPAVPSLHGGVQKPHGDNLKEKQGRRSGFPERSGPGRPRRALHPKREAPPCQAQDAPWALSSPWQRESIRVREGHGQAPHLLPGPLWKPPHSRPCPCPRGRTQSPHETLRPNSIRSGQGLGQGAVTGKKRRSSPAPLVRVRWPGSPSKHADGQEPLLCPCVHWSPCRPPKWFPNQAARSADTLRTGRRVGTPNSGQALPPHCPAITRARVHALLLGCQPWQLHLSMPLFQSQPPSVSGRKADHDGHVPWTEGAPKVQRQRVQEPPAPAMITAPSDGGRADPAARASHPRPHSTVLQPSALPAGTPAPGSTA